MNLFILLVRRMFEKEAQDIRKRIIEICKKKKTGHLASCLSCVEIIVSLYYGVMEKGDQFIISKGHGAGTLYCVLEKLGIFPDGLLDKFGTDELYTHPEHSYPGVLVSGGSLGHGLGIGCGVALGFDRSLRNNRVFVLLGDGECFEGSVWESAIFASNNKLGNLSVIVDHNGISATDYISNYSSVNIDSIFESIGFDVSLVDGHNIEELSEELRYSSAKPKVVIASTIKGRGVDKLENNKLCHTMIPS